MRNKTIVIWAAGGKRIGLGHIRRCLVIAQELQKKGIDILFFINDDPTAINWIKQEGFYYKVSSFSDSENKVVNTALKNSSLILIDTKKPVAELIRSLKAKGCKLILMDNVTDARLVADAVIYPTAIFDNNLDWKGFNGKVFAGADYVPIAESFIKTRERTKYQRIHPPYQVLVSMGGSDPNHLTCRVVSSLLKSHESINIKVVIGPAFLPDPVLNKIEEQYYNNVEFIRDKDDLSALMAESHIAITALGTTIYELACLGVPSIIIANYRTDEMDTEAFRKLGISLPLGYYEDVSDAAIRQALEMLLKDSRLWGNMSQKGRMIVDGKGAERIAAVVEKLLVKSL
jgi:UDP-2,4-diacetamido-2,4,6-trideoxy-beta-L-altropyranose hydrolase